MTTPISGTSGTAATPKATASLADAGMDKDAFMKLLVAQLKYQNPMSPADGSQYMSQMAVFAQVEKLGQLVEGQASAQAWQERLWAAGLVGKQVTGYTGADATDKRTGVVTGYGAHDGKVELTLADGTTLELDGITDVAQQ